MSASEKLKGLAVANDLEADHWDRVTASMRIREALPQIVAVVEAAQGWYEIGEDEYLRLPKFAQQHYQPIHEDETPTLERCFRLAALAALDEALT